MFQLSTASKAIMFLLPLFEPISPAAIGLLAMHMWLTEKSREVIPLQYFMVTDVWSRSHTSVTQSHSEVLQRILPEK